MIQILWRLTESVQAACFHLDKAFILYFPIFLWMCLQRWYATSKKFQKRRPLASMDLRTVKTLEFLIHTIL